MSIGFTLDLPNSGKKLICHFLCISAIMVLLIFQSGWYQVKIMAWIQQNIQCSWHKSGCCFYYRLCLLNCAFDLQFPFSCILFKCICAAIFMVNDKWSWLNQKKLRLFNIWWFFPNTTHILTKFSHSELLSMREVSFYVPDLICHCYF